MGTNSNTSTNRSRQKKSPKKAHPRRGVKSPSRGVKSPHKITSNRTSPIHMYGGEIKTCPDDLEDYLLQLENKQEEDYNQFYSIEATRIDEKKADKILKETATAGAEHAEDTASLDKQITDSRVNWQEHKKQITKYSDELCKVQDQIFQLQNDIDLIRGLDPSVITNEDLKKKEQLEKRMRGLQDKQSSVSVKASQPFDPKLKRGRGDGGGCSIM